MSDINTQDQTEDLGLDQKAAEDSYEQKSYNHEDNFYNKVESARVNISARETEGSFISNVGRMKSQMIESIVKALGTMVQEPEFTTDQNNIGQKTFKMYIQKPILEGEDRKKVIEKLVEIITTA